MERNSKSEPLSTQIKNHVSKPVIKKQEEEYDGDFGKVISTGSTLLDLAISGGRVKGGGLPGGILVEVFGPNQSGKTVLLSEIAGAIQRQGGEIQFHDPEARLNTTFAQLFGMKIKEEDYYVPDKVPEVFEVVRSWEPKGKKDIIHGVFADSLAALSTKMEMEEDEGDKMGMRRAKEFSEQLRKTCRVIKEKNYLMVCSNQIRDNLDTQSHIKYITPGGKAMGFYSSLRLRFNNPEKINAEATVAGKVVKRVVGVKTVVEVFKSSIWSPFRTAPIVIIFDYGIDNVMTSLQFIKDYTKNTIYTINGESLDKSMGKAIQIIEEEKLESQLREEVIDLWGNIESKFKSDRKPKER
jgi:recombination protein RecA